MEKRELKVEHLTLFVTTRCNLNCDYCYCGTKGLDDMSINTAQKAVDIILSQTGISLSFFGGEPLLRLDFILSLCCFLHEYNTNIKLQLTTNGLLLTKDVWQSLNEYKVNITLSLDGSKQRHDARRKDIHGNGSWDRIIKNSEDWITKPLVRMTFHPKECEGITRDISTLSELGFHSFVLVPTDGIEWNEDFFHSLKKEYMSLGSLFIDSYRRNNPLSIDCIDQRILSHTKRFIRRCLPGVKTMSVLPDGNIYPCHRINIQSPAYCIGNVWTGLSINDLDEWERLSEMHDTTCVQCILNNRCVSCPVENIKENATNICIPDYKCQLNQLQISIADFVAQTLYKERNMHFMKRFFEI